VRIVTENKYANRKLIKKRGGGDNVVSQAHMIKTNACLPQTKVKLVDFAYPLQTSLNKGVVTGNSVVLIN
jgi:hypothetical protein